MNNTVNPDLKWYASVSAQRNTHLRCPFATAGSCPRFYQSLSLLGRAGSTAIEPEEDKRLLEKWQKSDLWPNTAEQSTSVSGGKNDPKYFDHFCPEVSYERFGYFASYLGRYAATLDSELAQEKLGRENVPIEDWRWYWSSVIPMHYTECPLYSVLAHRERVQPVSASARSSESVGGKAVTLIRVFLAAPSDIEEEIKIVFDAIHEWNDAHSSASSAILKLDRWKTASHPEMGDRPQAIINRQGLAGSDILVGIFWSRFGSPTGKAQSGTEEEIRLSIEEQRKVMLYFSDMPLPPSKVDNSQYRKVLKFKKEFKSKGLFGTYQTREEFRDDFRLHLAKTVQSVLKELRTDDTRPQRKANALNFSGINEGVVGNVNFVTMKVAGKRGKRMAYPEGCIGADLSKRNYVYYLTKRYNDFRKADKSYGSHRPFHFSVIHKMIESQFGNPTYNLPVALFQSVSEFVKEKIDGTILGKNNLRKLVENYRTFEKFIQDQRAKAVTKTRGKGKR